MRNNAFPFIRTGYILVIPDQYLRVRIIEAYQIQLIIIAFHTTFHRDNEKNIGNCATRIAFDLSHLTILKINNNNRCSLAVPILAV